MTTQTWRITASTTAPGWLGMPAPADAAGDDAWVGERTDGLRAAFGERWTPELEPVVPALLRAGLDRRDPEALLSWQVWPGALPAFATVHARVVDAASLPDWAAAGATVQPYASATLGPGVQVTATAPLDDLQPGATAAFVVYAFDDGTAAVVVEVEPTLAELLALTMAGVRELVDRIAIERPDGTGFQGVAPAGFIADGEGWPLEEGAA